MSYDIPDTKIAFLPTLGNLVAYQGKEEGKIDPLEGTKVIACFIDEDSKETSFLILHHQGEKVDILLDKKGFTKGNYIEGFDPKDLYLLVQAEELHPIDPELIDCSCPTFQKLPLWDRLPLAIQGDHKAYIGKLFLTGELAPISRIDYEQLQAEHDMILQFAHALNDAIKPIFNEEGRKLILSFFAEGGKPKIGKIARDFFRPSRSRLLQLLQTCKLSSFQELPSGLLLEVSQKHGLSFNHIEALIRELKPKTKHD